MSVKIEDKSNQILQQMRVKAAIFIRNVADEIVVESKARTPKKSGRLRIDVVKRVSGLKGSITWEKDYARKMEFVQFKKYTTPGTGAGFAKAAISKVIGNTGKIARLSGLVQK